MTAWRDSFTLSDGNSARLPCKKPPVPVNSWAVLHDLRASYLPPSGSAMLRLREWLGHSGTWDAQLRPKCRIQRCQWLDERCKSLSGSQNLTQLLCAHTLITSKQITGEDGELYSHSNPIVSTCAHVIKPKSLVRGLLIRIIWVVSVVMKQRFCQVMLTYEHKCMYAFTGSQHLPIQNL